MPWIDRLKALAILWIVLNHIVERLVGGAYAANPTVPWPPLAERIAQFSPVHGAGIANWPLTLVRDLGWFGDQGVTLFLILSGFGLTWGLLRSHSPAKLDLGWFYRRRFARILPLWWGVNVLFFLKGLAFGGGLSLGDWQFYPSLVGLRFIPNVFYYYSPAWWYIGLIVQLYLIFPILWRTLQTRGPLVLLGFGCGIGFVALALGPLLFHDAYLDAWQRGAFFMTRLPEFTLGMALAAWWSANPRRLEALLRSRSLWLIALAAYALGTALSFTLAGMIVAPLLLGTSAFVLLFPLASWRGPADWAFQRLGRDSYALYLVHERLVAQFVPSAFASAKFTLAKAALGITVALVATAFATALLIWGVRLAERVLARARLRSGSAGPAAVVASFLFAIVVLPIAADRAVFAFDPQEVEGWGERSSLQPSERFGWTLIPNRTTRLRWQSYDYGVTANALGFPGPAFAQPKPPGTLRILVTGDAFSSAEGVDTDRGWPRLLQSDLERRLHRNVQVMNFAITGYGPNQEAAVIEAFAPRLRPDIVLVEMFANDVDDQTISNDDFRKSIGFDKPSPTGLQSILSLQQLHAFVQLRIAAPLVSFVLRKPTNEGYFLGNFRFLERSRAESYDAGVRGAAANYKAIARTARAVGARTIVTFVPAPAEVCDRRGLSYYPRGVDLGNALKFDRNLPDARAREIAAAANVPLWNLRVPLQAVQTCPYMTANMHFTQAGHAAVADVLARRIAALQ